MQAVNDDVMELMDGDGNELDDNLQAESREYSNDSSGVTLSDSELKRMKEGGDGEASISDDDKNEEDELELMEERPRRQEESSEENDDEEDEDDDVMEIMEADPLGEKEVKNYSSPRAALNLSGNEHKRKSDLIISPVNNYKPKLEPGGISPLVKEVVSRQEATKPTLVIIDTNSILSGKGPVPAQHNAVSRTSDGLQPHYETVSSKSIPNLKIPDDAFLIEAPSFIVPYVFEQKGEKMLKDTLKELQEAIKKEKEEKGEEFEPIPEKKKNDNEDYFDSPVGKLLSSVGMNLVQEYVQADLLKMQKKKAEKERQKSRGGFVPMQTQQSIISLKNNLEESKENNEPFRHRLRKCELCNFKTESELVMSSHLETPHMRNFNYRCNFCTYTTRYPHEILFHMEANHKVRPRLERAPAYHQCPNCPYEDNSKAKLSRHIQGCTKRFRIEKNLEPPQDWDTPAKLRLSKNRLMPQGLLNQAYIFNQQQQQLQQQRTANPITYPNLAPKFIPGQKIALPPLLQAPRIKNLPGLVRPSPKVMGLGTPTGSNQIQINRGLTGRGGNVLSGHGFGETHNIQMNNNNQILQNNAAMQIRNLKGASQPSISITPLPRQPAASQQGNTSQKPQGKTSFVICEICDGYIKDLDQLRNHMQWIHKVKIHPKMIYNKPPLNCQKCQFRFFTDQGLERHLLGSHGLVTSSMQDAANKGQDNGRCPLCGKVYQWKLLAHVAKDHNVTLKPAHLSYKCTVCTATFGMYKLFESHVYSAHSMNSKRNDTRRPAPVNPPMNNRANQMQVTSRPISNIQPQNNFRPLKINDEITIIPQPSANAIQRNRGALTITPQLTRRMVRGNEDEGIQIIEIDDSPQRNGRKENGDFRGKLPISDSILRKRNLEISLCGSENSDESFHQAPVKRLRQN